MGYGEIRMIAARCIMTLNAHDRSLVGVVIDKAILGGQYGVELAGVEGES